MFTTCKMTKKETAHRKGGGATHSNQTFNIAVNDFDAEISF